MGSLGRQPNLTGLVAAVLGVLLSVAGLAPAGLSQAPVDRTVSSGWAPRMQ